MITVANCYDIQEALRLQMALAAADIPSDIPDEATALNAPFFSGSGAGVRLQVAEENAIEAQQIISDARPKASPEEIPQESHDQNREESASDQDEEEQRV
jgi:hypothetical protein